MQMAENSNATFAQSISEYLVGRRADQFALLSGLVRVNSENPPGDMAAISDKLQAVLATLDMEAETLASGNLRVRIGFGDAPDDGPSLALCAHVDTPPVGAEWTRDPCGAEIESGRMFGRGASDGKGDLAAYLFALAAIRDCQADLAGTVDILITFDGATGGERGARRMLADGEMNPDFVVVPGTARAIGTTATGVLDMDVEVQGMAAPAGVPTSGADAMEGAASIMTALYRHRDTLGKHTSDIEGIGSPTLVITEVRGGEGALLVPDRVTLLVDRRLLPEEDAGAVERELTNIIGRAVVAAPGVRCKVRRRRLLPAAVPGTAVAQLVSDIQDEGERIADGRPGLYGAAFETPLRDFAAAGIPTVMYGAGGIESGRLTAVRANESLDLDDLRIATEVLANVIGRMLANAVTDQAESNEP